MARKRFHVRTQHRAFPRPGIRRYVETLWGTFGANRFHVKTFPRRSQAKSVSPSDVETFPRFFDVETSPPDPKTFPRTANVSTSNVSTCRPRDSIFSRLRRRGNVTPSKRNLRKALAKTFPRRRLLTLRGDVSTSKPFPRQAGRFHVPKKARNLRAAVRPFRQTFPRLRGTARGNVQRRGNVSTSRASVKRFHAPHVETFRAKRLVSGERGNVRGASHRRWYVETV
jgi:hypothetical protein